MICKLRGRSGKKRILLQLPGVKDPERIKELLGKTAKLTFHLVDDDNSAALNANIEPFGKMIVNDIYDESFKKSFSSFLLLFKLLILFLLLVLLLLLLFKL